MGHQEHAIQIIDRLLFLAITIITLARQHDGTCGQLIKFKTKVNLLRYYFVFSFLGAKAVVRSVFSGDKSNGIHSIILQSSRIASQNIGWVHTQCSCGLQNSLLSLQSALNLMAIFYSHNYSVKFIFREYSRQSTAITHYFPWKFSRKVNKNPVIFREYSR